VCALQVNLDLMISSLENFQKWNMLNISDILGPRFHRINVFYSTPGTCTSLLSYGDHDADRFITSFHSTKKNSLTSLVVGNTTDYYTAMKYEETVKARKQLKSIRQEQEQQSKAGHTGSSSTTVSTSATDGNMWSIKRRGDDFFPYADCPHCFWTGYFTSRTAFKRFERVASAFLQAARQLESLYILSNIANTTNNNIGNCQRPLWTLEDALGVVQHHDAVSGTAKVLLRGNKQTK
jgi:Alpha mannosidase middle domain